MWQSSASTPDAKRQQGMALLVSMVLIFVMSVLGISAMRSATLEGRMVSNSFQKALTFEAAESASDDIISDDGIIESSICTSGQQVTTMTKLSAGSRINTDGYITYGGSTIVLNYSLDSGFGAVKFIAGGEATIANTTTKTEVSQGIYLIGPAQIGGGC